MPVAELMAERLSAVITSAFILDLGNHASGVEQ
jgi:hypothetical protein